MDPGVGEVLQDVGGHVERLPVRDGVHDDDGVNLGNRGRLQDLRPPAVARLVNEALIFLENYIYITSADDCLC